MGYPIVFGIPRYFAHDMPQGISIAKSTAAILFSRYLHVVLTCLWLDHVAFKFEQRHKSEEHNEVDRTEWRC